MECKYDDHCWSLFVVLVMLSLGRWERRAANKEFVEASVTALYSLNQNLLGLLLLLLVLLLLLLLLLFLYRKELMRFVTRELQSTESNSLFLSQLIFRHPRVSLASRHEKIEGSTKESVSVEHQKVSHKTNDPTGRCYRARRRWYGALRIGSVCPSACGAALGAIFNP